MTKSYFLQKYIVCVCEVSLSFHGNSLTIESSEFFFNSSTVLDRLNK